MAGQGSVTFLGRKLLLGLREQAGFSSSQWCVEFLLPRGGLPGVGAQSEEEGWQMAEEFGGLGGLPNNS